MNILNDSRLSLKTSIILLLILFATFLSINSQQQIPIVDKDIIEQIFHQNQIFMIYKTQNDTESSRLLSQYLEFCKEYQAQCAILNTKSHEYDKIQAFVSANKDHYFFIIDSARRNKFILPIIEGMTKTDLLIFQSKFEQGSLTPYLASQQPDKEPYLPCQKVVSQDLSQFLDAETPVKVLFMFTSHSLCQLCPYILQSYQSIAQKMYDPQKIIFGYYDIFLNDSPLIKDENLLFFNIYSNSQENIGIPGQNIEALQLKLREITGQNQNGRPIDMKQSFDEQFTSQSIDSRGQFSNDQGTVELKDEINVDNQQL